MLAAEEALEAGQGPAIEAAALHEPAPRVLQGGHLSEVEGDLEVVGAEPVMEQRARAAVEPGRSAEIAARMDDRGESREVRASPP